MLNFKFSLRAIKTGKLKILVFVILCISFRSFGQLEVVSIYRDIDSKTQQTNARTATLTPMALPFWDDFSFNNSPYWPNATLWENSNSVWVNSGSGINPPTINVATFDGYDSLGKPYATDALAKGVADKMTSRTLLLGDIPAANRNAVFISFFYQYAGNGDAPEPGDIFSLYFKNNGGQWEQVWSIDNSTPLSKTEFKEIKIPIRDTKFFHNNFQFRFQSFGRLSGPFDVWNLDYVYVSNGKSQYAPVYEDHPDRAVSTPLTSLFKDYWAMPLSHFFSIPYPVNQVNPITILNNLRQDQTPVQGGQPARFTTTVTIYSKNIGTSSTAFLNNNRPVIGNLYFNDPKTILLNSDPLPDLTSFSSEKDSLNIKIDFLLISNDNLKKRKENGNDVGDFDTLTYKGIDFRLNDITSSQNILANYYAYDDGVAEYGAKIVGKGTQLAYEFDMKTTSSDTIVAVDIYFPRFGDDSNQTIQLFLAKSLTGGVSDYLYQQDFIVQRNTRNKFWRLKIPSGIIVKDKFYVGWKLNSEAIIPVGLDASNDSGSKIFYKNPNSDTWVQNTNIKGSLMIRPRFGKPQNVTTNILGAKEIFLYPNPTNGTFYLPADAEQIQLVDLTGKEFNFNLQHQLDSKQITMSNPVMGVFLVRYFTNQWITQKIMVLP